MRRGTSECSAVYLSNYLGLAWSSALVGGMPMRRTLYFKSCACLLSNRAYEDPESHWLWRQGGDLLEPREYGLPNMGVSGRFLQPLCSSVVLGPPMPLIMHAGRPRWWIKAANLSSILIISCASTAQRNFPLLSRKTCGEDLAGVGGRSWMRLGASSLLLPRRRLRSDGRWSLGQEQKAPSAASWVTKQPYLGSTLLTSTRGGA